MAKMEHKPESHFVTDKNTNARLLVWRRRLATASYFVRTKILSIFLRRVVAKKLLTIGKTHSAQAKSSTILQARVGMSGRRKK